MQRIQADRNMLIARVFGARIVVFARPDDSSRVAVIHGSTYGQPWRTTYLDGQEPTGHCEYRTLEDAVIQTAPGWNLYSVDGKIVLDAE